MWLSCYKQWFLLVYIQKIHSQLLFRMCWQSYNVINNEQLPCAFIVYEQFGQYLFKQIDTKYSNDVDECYEH